MPYKDKAKQYAAHRRWVLRHPRKIRLLHREAARRYRVKHKEELRIKSFQRDVELRKKVIEFLGGKCESCGVTNPIILEIHHNNAIMKRARYRVSEWYRILRGEVDKKDLKLLCANCHKILTYEQYKNQVFQANRTVK